jgi:hypothetical protein
LVGGPASPWLTPHAGAAPRTFRAVLEAGKPSANGARSRGNRPSVVHRRNGNPRFLDRQLATDSREARVWRGSFWTCAISWAENTVSGFPRYGCAACAFQCAIAQTAADDLRRPESCWRVSRRSRPECLARGDTVVMSLLLCRCPRSAGNIFFGTFAQGRCCADSSAPTGSCRPACF